MKFNTSKSLSSTNCAITGTAIKCTNTLINDDVEFIKNNASTVTSLDLTATFDDSLDSISTITQKQLDNLTSTAFPLLDTLSISYNEITNLNLAKFPALTKLTAMGVKNITGFNDIKNNLTTVEISKESRIDLADIIGIADKTKVTTLGLGDYIETNLNISGFTNLMNLSVSDMENLTTLDLSKLTNLTNLDIWYIENLATLDLSKLTNLTNLQVSDMDNLVTLTLPTEAKNLTILKVWSLPQLNKLDISEFTNLTNLKVWGINNLTALTLPTEAKNLTILEVCQLAITELDISALTNLTILEVCNLAITEFDISALTNLTKLEVNNLPKLTALTLSALTANLTSLLLGSNTSLATLNLGTTSFVKGLEVTGRGNTALKTINNIIFVENDKITINLTNPKIGYSPAS